MSNQYSVLGEEPSKDYLQSFVSQQPHITIEGLTAGYGKMEILHDINLYAEKGQSLCLIGPNGAGKSTILHSVYGFTNIFKGKITCQGVAEAFDLDYTPANQVL